MTKISKSESNAKNAQKSTGPKTSVGKAKASQNALSHGILSAQLILAGESRGEFDALFAQLQQEFKPEGLLEMTLTERIAIAIWRQKRLVSAESAEMALHQQSALTNATYAVRSAVGEFATESVVRQEWLRQSDLSDSLSVDELDALAKTWRSASYSVADIATMSTHHPALYQELVLETKEHNYDSPELFIKDEFDGLSEYLSAQSNYYLESHQRAIIRDLIKLYKESIALPRRPEQMSRYQSALDNDLYKAMRALREAQDWRGERREAEASVVVAQTD
jgi:hypothetical protein